MLGRFGTALFGTTEFTSRVLRVGRRVALLGDGSDHGGTIITTNQDGSLKVGGMEVAVEGALHSCPLPGHGVTPISAITKITYQNGELILTEKAVAGCGAVITPIDRSIYIE